MAVIDYRAFFYLLSSGLYRRLRNLTVSCLSACGLYRRWGVAPPASKIAIFCLISLELVGRVSGEVSDNAVGIIQIEHLKDGVGSLAVLTFHDGVLKHGLAVQADPCILRA